jgi:exopolyphosphatase / guanosine-5'-triphosphate,3'-diphosphate pyrophosphatase
MGRILAAADIGSNTAHVLIGEVEGRNLRRIENRSEWIGLGEIVARHGHIPDETVEELVAHLKMFKRLSRNEGAEYLYIFATEAMRAASNHTQILERLREETDLPIDLIAPRREAELSLEGVMLDSPNDADLILEVGGGSAQIGRVLEGKLEDSGSAPIGTGRLIAEASLKTPATSHAVRVAEQYVHERLDEIAMRLGPHPTKVVASGGVGRGLWRALHPDGDPVIHREELRYMTWVASHLTISRLARRFGVKNKRASTLLPGAIAYASLMDRFELTEMHVSEYGVREGALLQISKGAIQGCLM